MVLMFRLSATIPVGFSVTPAPHVARLRRRRPRKTRYSGSTRQAAGPPSSDRPAASAKTQYAASGAAYGIQARQNRPSVLALVPVGDLLCDVGIQRGQARHLGVERGVLGADALFGALEARGVSVLLVLVAREVGTQAGLARG